MTYETWKQILEDLRQEFTSQVYNTWIQPLQFIDYKENTIFIQAENKFIKDWVEKNYKPNILKNIKNYLPEAIDLNISINKNNNKSTKNKNSHKNIDNHIYKTENEVKNSTTSKNNNSNTNLNKNYTFESFISGSSNQFASAAAMAVANNPATTYNPLFIYGGVGLGKTHLINAIGNSLTANYPDISLFYYTSEKFMNELINSLRYAKMEDFRSKFRYVDVLLIDDIQFIAGKERTQEEFFHTFNSLYESHKQIVVTSDRFPKDIPQLEERLRSRFEWGLIADIQPPDIETKQAIINIKAEQNNIFIPKDVSNYLANSLTNNVRKLEGYLVRLGAYASLTSTPITLDFTKKVLKDMLIEKNGEISIEDIQKEVCKEFNIKLNEIKSSKRNKNLVTPRQIAMSLARELTQASYPEIGHQFGGKDHSTIIYAIKKINKEIQQNEILNKKYINIKNNLS